jgi:PAS domain S-box-containing protein
MRQINEGKLRQFSMEKRYLRLDGTMVWIAFSYQRQHYADGGFEELTTLVDITESKRAEAELAYERDLLRTLLDNSMDHIYFKDTRSRFIKCSRSQARVFGLASAEELVGKTDFDFFSDEHARPAFDDEQTIMRTGEPMIGKMERESWNDGRKESWVLTTKMPFRNKAGEVAGTFGISKDITPIKEAEARLETAHQQLLETSRLAGMAEVATSVLHNVGNVLNSVNVSTTLVLELVKKSRLSNLGRLAAMINEQQGNLANFFADDPRGKQLPGYFTKLAEHLAAEQSELVAEIEQTRKNIEHIKDIVTMQQNYAKVSGVVEKVKVTDLVEDALRMNGGALTRHNIELICDYPADAVECSVERQKVLQILVNLIRNAKYACEESGRPDKRLTMQVRADNGRAQIIVLDNGVGIPAENLTRIFNHGFTTREHGHGFGLHSGALAANELGGSLAAHSDGPGTGSRFVLDLPLEPPQKL